MDPLDTPERSAARREASLPQLLFQLSSARDYVDAAEEALKRGDWEGAFTAGHRAHDEVCETNHSVSHLMPPEAMRRMKAEQIAEQLGIPPESIIHLESGDELAQKIQEGILDPASKRQLTDFLEAHDLAHPPPSEDGGPGAGQ